MQAATQQLLRSTRRGGSTLPYSVVALIALIGIASLAVDYGHVQLVKTELQRAADATARGELALYQANNFDASFAQTWGAYLPTQTINPINSASGKNPTVSIVWGSWNQTTKTFTAGSYSSTNAAVKVTLSCTQANNNGIHLTWAAVLGRRWSDVTVTTVAAMQGGASANVNVSAQSDPWLAGMPSGSGASYNDTAPGQSPTAVTSIPVVPGSYITITNVSGQTRHAPTMSDSDSEGGAMYSHGIDSPGGPTPAAENGIADIVAPIDSLLGVFLGSGQPDASSAPSRRDYSSFAARDMDAYDDIELKQPFFIGDGKTSGGAVQTFKVPPGATRLYLGTMDGYEWGNNSGSLTVTLQMVRTISIVQ